LEVTTTMINIRKTQMNLAAAGYSPGPIDGEWGAQTCMALLAHQAQRQPQQHRWHMAAPARPFAHGFAHDG
jgi:hypothetical protein